MEWINNWIENRNNDEYKSIIVTNKFRFPEIVEQTRHLDDVAYISISATEDCVKGFFLGDEKEMEHYLPDANNVLNLNFDDITEDSFREAAHEIHMGERFAAGRYHSICGRFRRALRDAASELTDAGFSKASEIEDRILKSGGYAKIG